MSKKQKFIDFVNEHLFIDLDTSTIDPDVASYWEALCSNEEQEKPMFTENGKLVMKFLQEHQDVPNWKARDIAEEMFTAPRTVSGALRKLVSDNFVEKMGEGNPKVYSLTEKGKNIIIEEN